MYGEAQLWTDIGCDQLNYSQHISEHSANHASMDLV